MSFQIPCSAAAMTPVLPSVPVTSVAATRRASAVPCVNASHRHPLPRHARSDRVGSTTPATAGPVQAPDRAFGWPAPATPRERARALSSATPNSNPAVGWAVTESCGSSHTTEDPFASCRDRRSCVPHAATALSETTTSCRTGSLSDAQAVATGTCGWSPGRVGVRVMNSRSAQKEIMPNSPTVAQ